MEVGGRKRNTARNIHVINEEGEEGEDEDAESNSNSLDAPQNDLYAFREQWKRELEAAEKNIEVVEEDTEDDVHMKARELFLEAAALEEKGKLYEAIRFYKKAESLVPDIERQTFVYNTKVYEKQEKKRRESESSEHDENGNTSVQCEVDDNEEDVSNLPAKFARLLASEEAFQQEHESKMTHIAHLPSEVLNYILKWVVSPELDLLSLEACSQASRGFYLAARDDEVWRLICLRIWGPIQATTNVYPTWREMFLVRPRVQFNGCYTSKMSYIREGERGFQDHGNYRAWHIVEYFRYIRFFPGGKVVMVTCADDPALTMKQINNRVKCGIQGAMFGEYRFMGRVVVCTMASAKPSQKIINPRFRRNRRNSMVYHDVPEQEFNMEFHIMGPNHRMLSWKKYTCLSKYVKTNNEQVTDFDITNQNNYPKMMFQPVDTYHFESERPLK